MALVQSLTDDFNDNVRDATKWPNAYTSVATWAETGGRMVVTLANAAVGSNYAGYNTVPNTYDLTGSYLAVQIPTVPTGANCQVIVKLYIDGNNILYFQINNTSLAAVKVVAGVTTTVASNTYNSTNHQWLRVREKGGVTYWDTSANGGSWANLTNTANPITVTALLLEISAGTFASQASPGTAAFDNFNLPNPSSLGLMTMGVGN